MKKICICSDDYAISPAVSKGIRELIEAKRITAVSVMTLSEYWPDESQLLLPFKDNIDIGLHITLTNFKPIETMSKFAPKGIMPNINRLIKKAYLKTLPYQEISLEIERQLQRFYLYFGRWPDHIDGHHHVHILPGIRELIIKLFFRFLDHEKSYIRNCVDKLSKTSWRKVALAKAFAISMLGYKLKKQLDLNGILTNNGFSGIYNFNNYINYNDIFKSFLIRSNDQMLIMCHPGYIDNELRKLDHVVDSREIEQRFFLSEEFINLINSYNIQLSPLSKK